MGAGGTEYAAGSVGNTSNLGQFTDAEVPMALRKCPGCKNLIAVETESCPICGCNPRTRMLRRVVFWSAASVGTLALVGSQFRQHLPLGGAPAPAQSTMSAAAR